MELFQLVLILVPALCVGISIHKHKYIRDQGKIKAHVNNSISITATNHILYHSLKSQINQ
jgi:hypothetical protein